MKFRFYKNSKTTPSEQCQRMVGEIVSNVGWSRKKSNIPQPKYIFGEKVEGCYSVNY